MKPINIRMIVIGTILIFGLGSFCTPFQSIAIADLDNGPWPMFQHDIKHTGQSVYKNESGPFLKWRYQMGASAGSSPAIGSDGTIYVGSSDDHLYAINPDSSLKWRYDMGSNVDSSPAIGSDGTIYVGGGGYYGNYLCAINPDSSLKWCYETESDIDSSPAVGSDGTIYVGSWDQYLYAINPDGSSKWRYKTGGWISSSSPALGSGGTIYVGSMDGYLYAINHTGSLKWRYRTEDDIVSSPAVGSDGTIYVGSLDQYLYAINPTGSLKWRYRTGDDVYSSPAIGSDGTIYVGSRDRYLYAINPTGSLKWHYRMNYLIYGPPAIGSDGTIYVGSTGDYIGPVPFYAINPNGTLKWRYQTGDDVYFSIPISSDGTIYVACYDGYLYAIGSPASIVGIYGTVTDLSTGSPITNATVSIMNNEIQSGTDGFYSFELPQGVYSINSSKTGYETITIPNVLVVPGEGTELTIELTTPGPLNIVTTDLQPTEVEVEYNDRVRISGGTYPYTYSIPLGSLPLGLSLDTEYGNIYGTPTLAGSYTFAVGVEDDLGAYAERWFTIEVTEPLNIVTTSPLHSGTEGEQYFESLEATAGTQPYTFSIISGSLPQYLSLSTDGNITGTPKNGSSGPYQFTVRVTDDSGRTAEKSFNIDIYDPLLFETSRLNDGIVEQVYNQTIAASGGDGNYTWDVYYGILPAGLSLDGAGGVLSGTPTEATYGTIVFRVSDTDGRRTSKDFTIQVSEPLQILTTTLPTALVNSPFSEKIRTNGGIEPFTFSYEGQLPAGLTLDQDTGIISGTPTVAGFTNVNVTVADSTYPTSQADTQSLGIRAWSLLTITTSAVLPNSKKGVPTSPIVLNAGGSPSPYTWTIIAGYLPEGITLNSATGELSGTPQDQGDFIFTVQVQDANGDTATKEYFWHISGDLITVTGAIPDGAKDVSYSFTLEADGGLLPYSWRLKSGTLPTGLSFNGTTGTIYGKPTTQQTTREFTIEVSDSDSPAQTAEKVFNMQILDDLYVFNETLPNGRINEAYTTTISAQLGKPAYSWRLDSGILPPGLILTSSPSVATLQGTPTHTGIYVFTVEVSDTGTPVKYATKEYTIKIYGDVVIETTGLKTAQRGVPYSDNVVVSGGQIPYIWKIVSGGLPTGLSLNSTSGHVYGTTDLAVGQSSTFTARVTDLGDPTGFDEKELVIYVVEPMAIITDSLQGAALGYAYQATLEGEGGLSPHRWFIHNGSLPPGLTLSRDTGVISGTATKSGTYSFTVRLEDSAPVPNTVTKAFNITVIAINDADGDGLSDSIENATCTDPNDADTDDDCIPDGVEDANHNGFMDGNETDPCDRDTDGDGIQDGTEFGYTLSDANPDTNTNIFQPDLDPSTTTNPLDSDTDNDRLLDGEEDANHNGRVDSGETNPTVSDLARPNAMPWIPLLLLDE